MSGDASGPALEDYLGSLLQEGEKVSSGVFELDPRVALKKLQTFSWESPQAYAIPLLASGYHLGATRIEFAPASHSMRIDMLGIRPLTAAQLRDLFRYAFSNQDPGLRHLALSVVCALRQPKIEVKVQVGRDQASYSQQGQPQCERVTPALEAGLRFQLTRPGWSARWGLGPRITPPDRKQVAARTAYSPVVISWQGTLQARPPLPSCRARETYLHEKWPLPADWAAEQAFVSPGEFSAWIGLGCQDTGLIWMVDGLCFREDSSALGFPWVQVRVSAPLRLDASYQFFVRDSVYTQVLEHVRIRIESLVARHVRLTWDDPIALDLMRAVSVRWVMTGQEKLLLSLRRRLLQMTEDPRAWGADFHPTLEMASQELSGSSDPEEARKACLFLLRALCAGKIHRESSQIEPWVFRVTGDPLEIRHWYQRLVLADRYCPETLEGCAAILPRAVEEFEEDTRDADQALARVISGLSARRFDPHTLWNFAHQALLSVPDGFRETRNALVILGDDALRLERMK